RVISFASGATFSAGLLAHRFLGRGHGSPRAGGATSRRGARTCRGRISGAAWRDAVEISAPRTAGDLEQGQLPAGSSPRVRPVRGDVFASGQRSEAGRRAA